MPPKNFKIPAGEDVGRKALVKWLGGVDDGKMNVIPQSWIEKFNELDWKNTAKEKRRTEVAQWRVGKKTESGYLKFDCQVLQCSGKLTYLLILARKLIFTVIVLYCPI